jgi:hypothetical protein
VSTNEDRKPSKEYLQMHMVASLEGSD